jgi:hypothetical protein
MLLDKIHHRLSSPAPMILINVSCEPCVARFDSVKNGAMFRR